MKVQTLMLKGNQKLTNLIKLQNIKKYYKVGKEKIQVLKNIDLNIQKGEFVMIMGKSGSGKTTLLNENQRSVFRNKNIGFIFQQFNLIETLNIYQNIELPLIYNKISSKKEKKAIIEASLSSVGLLDKINQFPLQLSGGQQQRIAIARALVNNPQIIFADEPTGALDSETSEEIMKLLKKLNNNGKTIIMVTHDQDLTKYATEVITLKDGAFTSLEVPIWI